MGSKNSPNSVAMAAFLLWQIGSGTVKREKRQSRLIERRKERITQGLNVGRVKDNISSCQVPSDKWAHFLLGPKLLLVMGCVKLGEKNCVNLPSLGEQTTN